jgi:general secretion pathway protein D
VALWTNKNVILDRNVSGKVQIISPRKVTKEEAYQAFLSALNLLGMTTVETGKVIKIMPVRTAVKDNLKTFLGSKWTLLTDEIITQIVPLKYIDAKEIQNTLSRIVSSNSMIAYEKTNTLIISDSGYKVRRILDILELLDVQGQQPQVAIVPIRYADAKSIVDKINELMKGGAGRGSSAYKLLNG